MDPLSGTGCLTGTTGTAFHRPEGLRANAGGRTDGRPGFFPSTKVGQTYTFFPVDDLPKKLKTDPV
jgi:hypothetical protein